MKSKDMTIGRLYLTQDSGFYGSKVVRLLCFVDMPVYTGYGRSSTKTMKRLKVSGISADRDGSIVERTELGTMTPGQIRCEISEEFGFERVRSTMAMKVQQDEDRKLYDEHADAMIAALKEAGFPGAHHSIDGIIISQHSVAKWAREQ